MKVQLLQEISAKLDEILLLLEAYHEAIPFTITVLSMIFGGILALVISNTWKQ